MVINKPTVITNMKSFGVQKLNYIVRLYLVLYLVLYHNDCYFFIIFLLRFDCNRYIFFFKIYPYWTVKIIPSKLFACNISHPISFIIWILHLQHLYSFFRIKQIINRVSVLTTRLAFPLKIPENQKHKKLKRIK